MKRYPGNITKLTILTAMVLALLFAGACVDKGKKVQLPKGPEAVLLDDPESLGSAARPGLAVVYDQQKVRHVDQIASREHMLKYGHKGEPLAKLDHDFEEGKVFDSGHSRLVTMEITGFVHLAGTGVYEFQAYSNDGVRVFLAGRKLLEDPDVHGDRLSPIGHAQVEEPGWYGLKVRYFQRKGSSALRLLWKQPGDTGFSPIPAEAYRHIPSED